MDPSVLEALVKWPNVPACTGWLLLDRRGDWRMRDDACQAAGEPGDVIRHVALKAFIERNYEADEHGRWFFQNGPQRVFVDLAYTPFVVRLHHGTSTFSSGAGMTDPVLVDQCGDRFEPDACWLDDQGNVLFSRAHGAGTVALLHDHDLDLFTQHLLVADDETAPSIDWNNRMLNINSLNAADVPAHFGFVSRPTL